MLQLTPSPSSVPSAENPFPPSTSHENVAAESSPSSPSRNLFPPPTSHENVVAKSSPSSPSGNPFPPLTSHEVRPPPSPPESETAEDGDMRIRILSPVINPTETQTKLNWPKIIVTSCIAAALVIPFQTRYHSSPAIVLSCIAFSLSLLCTIMDNCVSSGYPILSQLLDALAIFFLVDGFLLLITNMLSPTLKSIIWALYFFLFLLVLVSKWLKIIKH